jgi:DNA polymerase III epsilon subunit-like protein
MTEILKYCFIDTETTGTFARKHGLIQIAGSIMNVHADGNKYEIDEINEEALAVNGQSRETIMKYPEPARAYSDFVALLAKHVDKYTKTDKFFFTGYNAGFDNDFMREFFKKNGDKYFGSWFFNPYWDVMQMALKHLRFQRAGMPDFQLATVAKAMGIDIEGELHDAFTDIRLTEKIFIECMGFLKEDEINGGS